MFYIFSARGRGLGESEAPGGGGGGDFLWKIPRGGAGAGRVFAGNLGGGGVNIFVSGPKCLPRTRLLGRQQKTKKGLRLALSISDDETQQFAISFRDF